MGKWKVLGKSGWVLSISFPATRPPAPPAWASSAPIHKDPAQLPRLPSPDSSQSLFRMIWRKINASKGGNAVLPDMAPGESEHPRDSSSLFSKVSSGLAANQISLSVGFETPHFSSLEKRHPHSSVSLLLAVRLWPVGKLPAEGGCLSWMPSLPAPTVTLLGWCHRGSRVTDPTGWPAPPSPRRAPFLRQPPLHQAPTGPHPIFVPLGPQPSSPLTAPSCLITLGPFFSPSPFVYPMSIY